MADFLTPPDLAAFLRAASGRPFSYGRFDCLLWLGEWIAVRHGTNPAAGFIGRYGSALSAARVIRKNGGMWSLIDGSVAPLGIRETVAPAQGDIALVDAPEGLMGAIVSGEFVAGISMSGLRFRKVPILAAWRV